MKKRKREKIEPQEVYELCSDAIKEGDFSSLRQLVGQYKIDDNLKDDAGWNLLHRACLSNQEGNCEIVVYLIKKGFDINGQTAVGQTPLHIAIDEALPHIVYDLLENNADLSIKDKVGNTPRETAIRVILECNQDKEFLPYLLKMVKRIKKKVDQQQQAKQSQANNVFRFIRNSGVIGSSEVEKNDDMASVLLGQ